MHKSYEIVAFTMICSTFLGLRDKTTNLLDVFFNTVCRRDCTYFFLENLSEPVLAHDVQAGVDVR